MAGLHLIPADLASLDHNPGQVLVLTAFSDERPLRGLAGLVDWRVCGKLSGWFLSEFATGEVNDRVLYPSQGRLSHPLMLLIGLGPRAQHRTDRAHAMAEEAACVVADLGVTQMTCGLFGLDQIPAPFERSIPGLIQVLNSFDGLERITLAVEPPLITTVQDLMDRSGRIRPPSPM